MTKEDKNICNLFAFIGVILSCIVRYFQDGNSEYIVIISIAISIWIGAYIPLSSIYEGETLKKLILKVIDDFKSKKSSVYISAIVSTIITTILVLKNEFVVKLNGIIEQFGRGVAIGSSVLILLIIIFSYIRSKRVQKGTI